MKSCRYGNIFVRYSTNLHTCMSFSKPNLQLCHGREFKIFYEICYFLVYTQHRITALLLSLKSEQAYLFILSLDFTPYSSSFLSLHSPWISFLLFSLHDFCIRRLSFSLFCHTFTPCLFCRTWTQQNLRWDSIPGLKRVPFVLGKYFLISHN